MADLQRFDVVIAGAGIAGSSLAALLAGRRMSVALVEPRTLSPVELPPTCAVSDFDPRVSALTPRSRALLEELDCWDVIAAYRQCAYRHMTVWDAEGTGTIDFDHTEVDVAALGHIVENRVIVNALLQKINAARDITPLSPRRLQSCERLPSGDMALALDDGSQLEAGLLVAADGAQSRVRELMGFKTREWDYGHQALVCTVQVERPHRDTAWQRFLASGPLALLPLPGTADQHCCSIVWSATEKVAGELLKLDDAAFCQALGHASEHRLGAVLACSGRHAFPLRQRHAVDYVQEGVALVADAAHTIHPLAGQGINLGLQDVAVLAEEIRAAQARGAVVGSLSVLRRYQRRRKGDNLLMMAAMDGFKRLFEQPSLPLRWLRNTGMRQVDQLSPLKRQLMRAAMGLQ